MRNQLISKPTKKIEFIFLEGVGVQLPLEPPLQFKADYKYNKYNKKRHAGRLCKNPNIDSYWFTLEYENMQKIRGFSILKIYCCDPFRLMFMHVETYTGY